ncbi:MAG TPA: AmmeMemoRadiSam system protein A [Dehalococcoidia bacterium]|nr:AmmeMemoRadiSam system protein A [Dehalococcoidia bacterium]
MANETSPVVRLARETVERFVRDGVVVQPEPTVPELRERAGVFVSIHKNGELRGCIGTFEPTRRNVAEEIVANAISAATSDPRFPPVSSSELGQLDYNVDILTRPQPVDSVEALDPKKYGVIVECGARRGLLLPDLEGVESVDQQIEICRMKAGIGPTEPVRLYRFEVQRFSESGH